MNGDKEEWVEVSDEGEGEGDSPGVESVLDGLEAAGALAVVEEEVEKWAEEL